MEETLEKALEHLLGAKVKLQAASRTDAGVHAAGQVVNFFSEAKEIDCGKLNDLLPPTLAIVSAEIEQIDFHPTLDAKYKEYRYQIDNMPFQLPSRRHLAWHFVYPLHLEKMQNAAGQLIGKKDFTALSNRKEEDNICNLLQIDIEKNGDTTFILTIYGCRFLYKMVRNIAGSLAHAGCGKLTDLNKILESKQRAKAGPTAPAHGLCLQKIFY